MAEFFKIVAQVFDQAVKLIGEVIGKVSALMQNLKGDTPPITSLVRALLSLIGLQ
jgi:hypothetical protein